MTKSYIPEKVFSDPQVAEVTILWKEQIYDQRLFFPGEKIYVGSHAQDLYLPSLGGSYEMANFDGRRIQVVLRKGVTGWLFKKDQAHSLANILQRELLPRRDACFSLNLTPTDSCEIDYDENLRVRIRFTNAPRQLSKISLKTNNSVMKESLLFSGTLHTAFLLLALSLAPIGPLQKMKDLSPRVAKLILQKAKPPEPEPIAKPPPVENIKQPEPLPVVKVRPPAPKRVVIRPSLKMKVTNRRPVQVSKALPEKRQQALTELGALAALSRLSSPAPSVVIAPLQMLENDQAGGLKINPTNQIVGLLKANEGKLPVMAGVTSITTQGKGYGSGAGYGVTRGLAGQRSIAGRVIGEPKLFGQIRTEGLTQNQVMSVVKQHLSLVQQCYERALLGQPDLIGRVEYEWVISPQGRVSQVRVKNSDVKAADALNTCVSSVFKRMKFPVASNGESTTPTIGFPFGRL